MKTNNRTKMVTGLVCMLLVSQFVFGGSISEVGFMQNSQAMFNSSKQELEEERKRKREAQKQIEDKRVMQTKFSTIMTNYKNYADRLNSSQGRCRILEDDIVKKGLTGNKIAMATLDRCQKAEQRINNDLPKLVQNAKSTLAAMKELRNDAVALGLAVGYMDSAIADLTAKVTLYEGAL